MAPGSGPFPHVLVGFDGSADSVEALRAAAAIATHCVVALSVQRPRAHFEPATDDDRDSSDRLRELARARLAEILDASPRGLRASAEVVVAQHDRVDRVLREYARSHGFQLVVLGRHGEGVLHRRSHLGRVAGALAADPGIPVLLLSAG